jgi:hypothetical protein
LVWFTLYKRGVGSDQQLINSVEKQSGWRRNDFAFPPPRRVINSVNTRKPFITPQRTLTLQHSTVAPMLLGCRRAVAALFLLFLLPYCAYAWSRSERLDMRKRVHGMVDHAFNSYMDFAFPRTHARRPHSPAPNYTN